MVLQIPPGHIVDAQRQVAILHLFDSRSSICEELLWCHFISLPPPLRACLYYLVARQACKVDVIVPVSFRHQCLYCLFVLLFIVYIVYCLYCLLLVLFIVYIIRRHGMLARSISMSVSFPHQQRQWQKSRPHVWSFLLSPSERARQQQIDDDDGDDDNDDVGDDGDIYIMLKCVCVPLTKNHHFRAERQRLEARCSLSLAGRRLALAYW